MEVTVKEQLADLNRKCAEIERDAEINNGGQFTPVSRIEHDAAMAQIRALRDSATALPRRTNSNSGAENLGAPPVQQPTARWKDMRSGLPINTFTPAERLSSRYEDAPHLSVGRLMQAMATGRWQHAEAERKVMNVFGDTAGSHFLIPDPLSAQVIDLARAKSVIFPWGATSVEMPSDTLAIARQVADPTFRTKAENDAFTESNPTFGNILLVAKTLGTVVTCSRELAEDAPNFASLMESSLSRGLGAEMDRLILLGNGGSEGIDGIKLRSGIGSTSSVGAIAWEDLHDATVAIQALNHQPNGYVVHPTIAGDCDILTSGAGTNAAKLWLGAPPSLAGVKRLSTTGITTADIIVGDGTKIVVGFRTQARIEMSTEAGNAFEKHQVRYKITLRFDFGLTHAEAFHNLTGITT